MQNVRIAIEFFKRDLKVYLKRIPRFVVQYAMVYPLLFGTCWAYIIPYAGSQAGAASATSSIIFVGTLLFALVPFGFAITADFLFDFEHDRFIDYQLIVLPVRYILIQRILFCALFMFVGLLAYFPFSSLLFRNLIVLPYASLVGAISMLASASLFVAAFQTAFVGYAKGTRQVRHFWRRVSYPLTMLGGFLVPWKVLAEFSPLLGYAVLANPYLYITEGLRNAMLGSDQFFYWPYCIVMLSLFTVVCVFASFYFFNKKVDPV